MSVDKNDEGAFIFQLNMEYVDFYMAWNEGNKSYINVLCEAKGSVVQVSLKKFH